MANIVIKGSSVNGTDTSDSFDVQYGNSLNIDGAGGIDFLNLVLSGHSDITYDPKLGAHSIDGTGAVTGTFKSFESLTFRGGSGNDSVRMINQHGTSSLTLYGGAGSDTLTLPYTHISTENFSIWHANEPLNPSLLQVAHGDGMFYMSDFEVIKLNDGYYSNSDMRRNLAIDVESLRFVRSLIGTEWANDHLGIGNGSNKDQYLWKDAMGITIGIEGQELTTTVTNMEFIFFGSGKLYVPAGTFVSIPYEGGMRHSIGDLEFVTNSSVEIIQVQGLNNTKFLSMAIDKVAPIVVSMSPESQSTNAGDKDNIVITFDEIIKRGSGNIVLKDSSGVVVESFNIASSDRVLVDGARLVIDPSIDLRPGAKYIVDFPAGAITDFSLNPHAGISGYTFAIRQAPNTVSGSNLDDIFFGVSGDDRIDGGNGLDTVMYSSSRSGYVISKNLDGSFAVLSGSGDIDILTNVERLSFADGRVALDVAGIAGQTYRIYQAAFNRTPDKGGLGFWIAQMDNEVTLAEVARGFVQSAEFQAQFGSATTLQVVQQLYLNVLGRSAEAGGLDYWVNVLSSGAATLAQVLEAFSESGENQTRVAAVIGSGFDYTPYG